MFELIDTGNEYYKCIMLIIVWIENCNDTHTSGIFFVPSNGQGHLAVEGLKDDDH